MQLTTPDLHFHTATCGPSAAPEQLCSPKVHTLNQCPFLSSVFQRPSLYVFSILWENNKGSRKSIFYLNIPSNIQGNDIFKVATHQLNLKVQKAMEISSFVCMCLCVHVHMTHYYFRQMFIKDSAL